MLTYKVYFKVALIPDGIDIYGFCPGFGDFRDDNIINKYLCKETESQKIIDYLYSIYKDYPNGEDIYDLTYIDNGMFKCKIIAENDTYQCDIQDILWPDEIIHKYIFVDETNRSIDLDVDTIEEEDEENDDEEGGKGDCPYCGENDVEFRCKECDNKICYPCRDRCSNCMETLCPTCNINEGICTSCLEEESEELEEEDEDEEDEEDEEDDEVEQKNI
jgi:hypothetical protein